VLLHYCHYHHRIIPGEVGAEGVVVYRYSADTMDRFLHLREKYVLYPFCIFSGYEAIHPMP